MNIAIVHDVYIEDGGAERVLLALLRIFPSADIYVPFATTEKRNLLDSLTTGIVRVSAMNRIPLLHKASLWYKPFLYLYWEHLPLSRYDVVISSSHSFSSKAVRPASPTIHISYIHTPPRYLYVEYNETRLLRHPIARILFGPVLLWLRIKDFEAAQQPDQLIANSKTVQKRIQKYYRRSSVVVYPPVHAPPVPKETKHRTYFLCVSRLARQKGIDLAIRACNRLHEELVVVGFGSEEHHLKKIAGPTVRFLGKVPDAQMTDIYASAKALLYPSIEEDFGMVPVEAMAQGVPVIGFRSGGVTETVIDGKTGVLFAHHTVSSLVSSIQRFNHMHISPLRCKAQAKKFSEARFARDIQKILKQTVRKHQNTQQRSM